jgi:hypothetical protein
MMFQNFSVTFQFDSPVGYSHFPDLMVYSGIMVCKTLDMRIKNRIHTSPPTSPNHDEITSIPGVAHLCLCETEKIWPEHHIVESIECDNANIIGYSVPESLELIGNRISGRISSSQKHSDKLSFGILLSYFESTSDSRLWLSDIWYFTDFLWPNLTFRFLNPVLVTIEMGTTITWCQPIRHSVMWAVNVEVGWRKQTQTGRDEPILKSLTMMIESRMWMEAGDFILHGTSRQVNS